MTPSSLRAVARAGLVALIIVALFVVLGGGPTRVDSPVAAAGGDLGAGGEFHPLTPSRILDTRRWDASPSMTPDGASFVADVVGRGGLPSFVDADGDGLDDQVLAVAVNITVVDPDAAGFLSAAGVGLVAGESSIVNFSAHDDVPNAAILRPGIGGRLEFTLTAPWVDAGSADVLVDVVGWFSTSLVMERGARLAPVTPYRVLDTRRTDTPLGPADAIEVPIRGRAGVPDDASVVGVVVNLTAVNDLVASQDTYLSVVPELPNGVPSTSTLNLHAGTIRPVGAIVPLGQNGSVVVFNRSGDVHVLVDVMGYLIDGADVSSRAGRVVPLAAPYRMLDSRQAQFGGQPFGPGRAEDWSMDSFIASVSVEGEWLGPQSAVIGNVTAASLRTDASIAVSSSFVTVAPADAALPDASLLNIVAGRDVANFALLAYGSSGDADAAVTLQNAFGYVDLIVDAAAVVLDEWPEPPATTSTSTSTSTSTTSTSSTTSTTTPDTTTTTSTTTSTTSTSTTTSTTSSSLPPISVAPAAERYP